MIKLNLDDYVNRAENKTSGKYKPLVYICSPYSGNVIANELWAKAHCRFAVEQNVIPLAPHLLFPQFMDDENPKERELAMEMNMILLEKCDEIWVFGKHKSKGMMQEIEKAKELKKKIEYFDFNVKIEPSLKTN